MKINKIPVKYFASCTKKDEAVKQLMMANDSIRKNYDNSNKIKSIFEQLFNFISDKTQEELLKIANYAHAYILHLIIQKNIESSEAFCLFFQAHCQNVFTKEQYCEFLQKVGDQYYNAQYFEIALPYYTLALHYSEYQTGHHTLHNTLIEKISLINRTLMQLIPADFWLKQRSRLKTLRNSLTIPIVNNLRETMKFNDLEVWNKSFKSFLYNSIKTICDHLGPSPCEFSICLSGSYGRGDGSLYSDLEFCIILQPQETLEKENALRMHSYFETLVTYIHLYLIEIGDVWSVDKNDDGLYYRKYMGIHLDTDDLSKLINKNVSQRYLIQTPHSLSEWVVHGFLIDAAEHQCLSHGLCQMEMIYQSDEHTHLFHDFMKDLSQQPLQQYIEHFMTLLDRQLSSLLNDQWFTKSHCDLKERFISPFIYIITNIMMSRTYQQGYFQMRSTFYQVFDIWREQKLLSANFINLLENTYTFLQILKFNGQRRRNSQPDFFLLPHVQPDNDNHNVSNMNLHELPRLTEDQVLSLHAVDALLCVFYENFIDILYQENEAQFDPIKNIICYILPTKPDYWLQLIATLFAHYFKNPAEYLMYYRLIPHHYQKNFLNYLQLNLTKLQDPNLDNLSQIFLITDINESTEENIDALYISSDEHSNNDINSYMTFSVKNNFQKLNTNQRKELLTALIGRVFHKLDLSSFAMELTDELLLALLQGTKLHLLELNLSKCNNISESIMNQLAYFCPRLKTLIINQWQGKNFIIDKRLQQLTYLEIKDCDHLYRIQLNAPALQVFKAPNNRALVEIKLSATRMKILSLRGCSALNEQALMTIMPRFTYLEKVSLRGCKKIHYISFREKFPYLLGHPFNKTKGQYYKNLRNNMLIFRLRFDAVIQRVSAKLNLRKMRLRSVDKF